jgi:TRAP-type C4-dicarboxylate transport system permease small subunit
MNAINRLLSFLAAINRPVAASGRWLAGALIAGMLLLAIIQILSRALFNHALDWSEEMARFMLVWAVLLVAPFAYRSGAKVAIGTLVESLPPRLIVVVSAILNALAGWICLRLLAESFSFFERGLSLSASALPIQMAWIYALVPVTLLALFLVSIELVLRLLGSLWRPDPRLRLNGSVAAVDEVE